MACFEQGGWEKRFEVFGVFVWPDGRRYEGFWFQGRQHGHGKSILKDGSTKYANWREGKREGDDDKPTEAVPPEE